MVIADWLNKLLVMFVQTGIQFTFSIRSQFVHLLKPLVKEQLLCTEGFIPNGF